MKIKNGVLLAFILAAIIALCGCSQYVLPKQEPFEPEKAVVEGETNAPLPDGIHVSNVDELLAAIAPNTVICLDEGEYDLSTASDYGLPGGTYYKWEIEFDGPQLVIEGVDSLSIIGAGADKTTLCAVPRYANVLTFANCSNVFITGLTAGHTTEPGYCTGGVLYLTDCSDTVIKGCDLFGCGILGIQAFNCKRLDVSDTVIRECSEGAVRINNCADSSFSGCIIRECGDYNIDIVDCRRVRFTYCEVDGEKYDDYFDGAYNEMMSEEKISEGSDVEAQSGSEREITVSTVDALLDAIAPDTVIFLENGDYDLSAATDYGQGSGKYYSWEEVFDGAQLVIRGVSNLRIVGENADKTTLCAVPRYANVLTFDDCSALSIEGITVGHTIEPGCCTGGVLNLSDCKSIRINRCELYGCGTYGIEAYSTKDIDVSETVIRECTYGALYLNSCSELSFDSCIIRDCKDVFDLMYMSSCMNVKFTGCNIRENSCGEWMNALIHTEFCKELSFKDCTFRGNKADPAFIFTGYSPVFEECTIKGNSFGKWYPGESDGFNGAKLLPALNSDGTELEVSKLS